MRKIFNRENKFYFYLVGIVTLMFAVIYSKYIFGGYAYVFSVAGDIGGDTVQSYYPLYSLISGFIHSLNFDIFSLQSGLGADLSFIFSYFCNPLDLLVCLFTENTLYIGIILSTYLKILFISLFSFAYFNDVLKNNSSALLSTIAWTFCSFIILWGQHYHFCTQMLNFTIFVLLLHKWLSGGKKYIYILVLFMSFFMINSYYFFYISGVFSVFYVFFYKLFCGEKIKKIIIKISQLAGLAFCSIATAAVFMIPIIYSFTSSERGLGLFSFDLLIKLLRPYDMHLYVTGLSRLISPDLVGNGFSVPWSGSINYYETAFLTSSILSFFALSYCLFFAKFKNKARVILLLSTVLISVPVFTHFLTFNMQAQRWTFCLIFIGALAIGHLGDFILNNDNNKLRKVSFISAIILFVLSVTLLLFEYFDYIDISMKLFAVIILFALIYFIIISSRKFNGRQKIQLCIGLMIIELVSFNYPSVSNRGVQKADEFNSLYNDGTEKAVDFLKQMDNSLYRISKTYDSVFLNDPLAQDYYGVTSYSSYHTKEAWAFAKLYGGEYKIRSHPNYIKFYEENIIGILGGKYILSIEELEDFELIKHIDSIYIYKNSHYVPFGSYYNFEYYENLITELPLMDRLDALGSGYFTPEETGLDESEFSNNFRKEDFNLKEATCQNCIIRESGDGFEVEGKTSDMMIYREYDIPKNSKDIPLDFIHLSFSASEAAKLQIYFDTGKDFSELESESFAVKKGENLIYIPLSQYNDFKRIRIDLVDNLQVVSVKEISYVIDANANSLEEGLTNATFIDSTLKGNVENKGENERMMMIPITYSENWNAALNGKNTKVFKINEGLIGVLVPNGNYSFTLKYSIKYFYIGAAISLASLTTFVIVIYLNVIKRKKKV